MFARTLRDDSAAVRVHHLSHEREPQTKSDRRPPRRVLALLEAIEHEREEPWCDALACVRHPHRQLPVLLRDPDADSAAARRELDRVREQIPEDLLQAVAIPDQTGDGRRNEGLDGNVLRLGVGPDLPAMIRDRSMSDSTSRVCAAALR
jgi:hypothetical protein